MATRTDTRLRSTARPRFVPALAESGRVRSRRRTRRVLGSWLFWLAIGLIVIWSVGPFLWVVITSFKLDRDLATLPPILPSEPTWSHYVNIVSGRPFYRYILNSLI
ncbi:MAG: hypothetical protein M3509_01055, partial [Chloroflexota bacterium]|nr:hypothetical protein [Chloroflexota bacterium]